MEDENKPKPEIEMHGRAPVIWSNEKSLGLHVGNNIKPANLSTTESKKITASDKIQAHEKEKDKLWTEKIHPEKAGTDDKIQKLKKEKEKEQPQHKAAEAEKKEAQAKKDEHAQKRKAKAKELESKACCRKLKKICRKVKGKVKQIKAKLIDKSAQQKEQQPRQSKLKSLLTREVKTEKIAPTKEQKEQRKHVPKEAGGGSLLRRMISKEGGGKSPTPVKAPIKSSPAKTK